MIVQINLCSRKCGSKSLFFLDILFDPYLVYNKKLISPETSLEIRNRQFP